MIWEWNDGSTDSQDHGWMDLTVSVGIDSSFIFQVGNMHGDHGGFFLFNVKELTESFLESLVKVN